MTRLGDNIIFIDTKDENMPQHDCLKHLELEMSTSLDFLGLSYDDETGVEVFRCKKCRKEYAIILLTKIISVDEAMIESQALFEG